MSDQVMSDAARLLRSKHPPDLLVAALDDESRAALLMRLVDTLSDVGRESLASFLAGREETWWTIESYTTRGLPFLIPSCSALLRKEAVLTGATALLPAPAALRVLRTDSSRDLRDAGYRPVKVLVRRAP